MTRKSHPWAVMALSSGASFGLEHFTSEAKAYVRVRELIASAEERRIDKIVISQRDRTSGHWHTFEVIEPKEQ